MQQHTMPENSNKKKKNLVFSGVMILTLSNILIKAIGLLFKIPITNIIGDEGMGYFNSAYRIYVWFYMLSTAGLPVALSIMISESRTVGNVKQTKKTFKITMVLFVIIGFIGMVLMMAGSKVFANLIGSEPIYYSIVAIAPTLFFVCVSSAMRGYFQGFQNMLPTAVSQVLESLGKLILGIIFAVYAVNKGYDLPIIAAYAIAGLTIGAAAAMVFLMIAKILHKDDTIPVENLVIKQNNELIKTLIKLAIPITISASVMSLTDLIDVMVIIRQLQSIGFTEEIALTIYGNYSALAVPMFNLPPALIYPISYSIIPLISAAKAAGDEAKSLTIMKSAIKVAAIIAIPCALGMSVLSKPILNLFFKSASVEMAAPLLSVLALSVFFIGMLSVTNAILQARGFERKPILSMLCGAGVKLISSFILIGIPSIGIYGAPIGTFLCYLTITAMNFYFLSKYVGITPSIVKIFVKPLIAALICSASALGSYLLLSSFIHVKVATILAIGIAAVVYVTMLLLIKGVSNDDILMLPKGQKILSILQKFRLMK